MTRDQLLQRTQLSPHERIIFPLDYPTIEQALHAVEILKDHVGLFKIGLEFHHAMTRQVLTAPTMKQAIGHLRVQRKLYKLLRGRIMWDGKFNDIPNTLTNAASCVSAMKVQMFTLHASSGNASIEGAVTYGAPALALGVTVLTSINEEECRSIFGNVEGGMHRSKLQVKVLYFAKKLMDAKAAGIVCSPQEVALLRISLGWDPLLVTPGIRPTWAPVNDQKRFTTPSEAIQSGADYLVVGRPIADPPSGTSVDAAKRIAEEIATAL